MPDLNDRWPPLPPGTHVRTVRPDWVSSDWTTEALASRQWGAAGTVLRHHDSHGLTYEVLHGATIGHYEPRELQVLYPADYIQRLTPEEAGVKRPGYRLPVPLDVDEEQDDIDQTTAEGYMMQDPRPAVRARLRPSNYADLTAREQWAIDKELGLLDWDGQ